MFETLWQDLRHGRRMLAKNPGFALVATLSIAVGVGANAAMFSVADGLILRPLPVPRARDLITISVMTPAGEVENGGVSYRDYVDLRDRTTSFEGLFAARSVFASFGGRRDEPAAVRLGLALTANAFELLGITPSLGRAFRLDEDAVAARDAVVVLAHDIWRHEFASDPAIVGATVRIGGGDFTVIGVAPPAFTGIDIYRPPAFYVPLATLPRLETADGLFERRDARRLRVMGRLKEGVSIEQANQEAVLLAQSLERAYPDTNTRYGLLVRSEMRARLAEYAPAAGLGLILVALSLAVLAVACANVAGLLASRTPARAGEIAIRQALGGERPRLLRQLLTESLLLALGGATMGLAVAYGGIVSFQRFQVAGDAGVKLTYQLDGRALAVGVAVAIAGATLSTLLVAWRATRRLDLVSTLRRSSTRGAPRSVAWGRSGLVAAQIGLTLSVLTVALSFYRAFEREYGVGPGFATERILLVNLDPTLARYDGPQTARFYDLLKARVRGLAGVTSVGITSFVPLSQGAIDLATVAPEGFTLPPGTESLTVFAARIDDSYLETIGIRVLEGRNFAPGDSAEAPRVAIVSEGMATRYWPDQSAVGKRLRLDDGEWAEIVGIATDTKHRLMRPASGDFLYLPRAQNPVGRSTLLVASESDSAALATAVRSAIAEIAPDVPIREVRTIEDFYEANAKTLNSVVVQTVAGMGTMGLALAMVGLYGLVAFAVSARTREIGIRMALGARPAVVLRMVLRESYVPTLLGVIGGMAASMAAQQFIDAVFPGATSDSREYLMVVPALAVIVMWAAYVPARRAARMDPLAALRQD